LHTWSADLVVDEPLARRLLAQFADLEVESLRRLAEGWDYAVWVVNDTWAFRFPRREVAVPGVEIEIRVLPALAPRLPLPVPAAVFVGQPSEGFPWPFFGAPFLRGHELGEAGVGEADRVGIAEQLGTFLRELHGVDVPHGLPVDQNARADMRALVPRARDHLRDLEALGSWRRPTVVDELLAEAEELPRPELTSVVHGDLHFRQLLVDEEARVTGVIDWVDLGRSDAALDLSLYWTYFPPAAREAFAAAYGAIDAERLLRARVVGIFLCTILARYGQLEGHRAVRDEALAGLARAAAP
jgi:aminoglycoside phosphotransferase (APT) family kinase protein